MTKAILITRAQMTKNNKSHNTGTCQNQIYTFPSSHFDNDRLMMYVKYNVSKLLISIEKLRKSNINGTTLPPHVQLRVWTMPLHHNNVRSRLLKSSRIMVCSKSLTR